MVKYLISLLICIGTPIWAAEWIHVDSTTKIPVVISGHKTPFKKLPDGYNPNDNNPFGPSGATMFLPVVRVDPPPFNDVIETVVRVTTTGSGGKEWPGAFEDPNWVISYSVITSDLTSSKEAKLAELRFDRNAALSSGYVIGPYTLNFDESTFNHLSQRLYFMEIAIEDGQIPPGATITFSDRNGKEVSVDSSQLRTQFINYGKAYQIILEKFVKAKDLIESAASPAEVDSVTWNF